MPLTPFPSSSSSTPSPTSLPPELWIRILAYNTDLTHLWTACRRVSPAFRAFAEQAFADTHLRTARIYFHLDKYNLGGSSRRPEIVTKFARFEAGRDKARVHFRVAGDKVEVPEFAIPTKSSNKKSQESKSRIARGSSRGKSKTPALAAAAGGLHALLLERWQQQVRDIRPECPNYVIQIGVMVNDTALPGLELELVQDSSASISFEWRGMLSAFFREQERLSRLADLWDCVPLDTSPESEGVSPERDVVLQLASGARAVAASGVAGIEPTVWTGKLWGMAEKGFRRRIRRARLREWYEGDEKMVWAIQTMEYLEGPPRLLKDVPGGRVGEKFFQYMYLPEYLLMDEWSSLQRIDAKTELVAMAGDERV
jgi:hypothetical protein